MKQNSGSKGFSEPPATSEILGLASVPPTHSARSTGMCCGGSPGPLLSLQAPGPCTGFRGLLWARIKSSRWFEHSWISNVTESVRGLPRVTGGRLQASGTRQHRWEEAGLLKWEYSIQGNSALNPRSWFFFFSQKANYYSWLVLLRNSQLTAILVTPEKVQVPLCWGDLMLQ